MGIFSEIWSLISFLVTIPFINYKKDMDLFEWIMFLVSIPFLISVFWFFPVLIIGWFVEAFSS
jgi:hypothetical protein